jgi:transcriptional regulator GlxA family with amidase domain
LLLKPVNSHRGVARSLKFLSAHWQEDISVSDLVKTAGMSRRGFLKAFQRHIGRAPGHELRRIRMEHARDLLMRSDHKLADISRRCGYQSSNSFWVAFRRANGISPRQFRDRVAR